MLRPRNRTGTNKSCPLADSRCPKATAAPPRCQNREGGRMLLKFSKLRCGVVVQCLARWLRIGNGESET